MYLLAAILIVAAVTSTFLLIRSIAPIVCNDGRGSLSIISPPGWLVAMMVGIPGLALILALVIVGTGAFLLRQWANRVALIMGLVGLVLSVPAYCVAILFSDPPHMLTFALPPLGIGLLAAINICLFRWMRPDGEKQR
jgi:hypothetical protein